MSQTPGSGSNRGQTPSMNIGMGGLATGIGYHGYQLPPGFAFPPQAMPTSTGTATAGGGMPMMAPPESYATHGTAHEKNASTHTCTVHPPGMPRPFDVPFPERRLPVCDRCKKNFKSRDLCRKRDGHKALPWQTTYIAVTITESALDMGENGSVTYADHPVIAELQDTPLMCLGPADGSMKMEPICKVCREKNYTRDYCRNTCKHTTPPWSTTYVKLVVDKSPQDEKEHNYHKKRKKNPEENADGKPNPDSDSLCIDTEDNSDDLAEIHKSKTFLAAISSKKMTVRVSSQPILFRPTCLVCSPSHHLFNFYRLASFQQWCERIQYPVAMDQDESTGNLHAAPPGSLTVPYLNTTNNPNPQHQNSQLWDAFRAGAMWAQSQGGQVPAGYGYGSMSNPSVGSPMTFFSQPSTAGLQLTGYQGGTAPLSPNRRPKAIDNYSPGGNVGEGEESVNLNQGQGVQ